MTSTVPPETKAILSIETRSRSASEILADLVAISGLMWVAEFPRVNPGTPRATQAGSLCYIGFPDY